MVDARREFVLDGFPRTVSQADWLLNQVKHKQLSITAVIHLQANKSTVRKRLLSRGRQDDTETAIKERFREYENAVVPIIEHFEAANILICNIDANQTIEVINKKIKAALKPVLKQ